MELFMPFLPHPSKIMIHKLVMNNSAAFVWSNTNPLAKELPFKVKETLIHQLFWVDNKYKYQWKIHSENTFHPRKYIAALSSGGLSAVIHLFCYNGH